MPPPPRRVCRPNCCLRILFPVRHKRACRRLTSLPTTDVPASHATKRLLSLPEYRAAKRISVYLSMPAGEISTAPIVRDALAQGKTVFIPFTYEPNVQRDGQPKSIMDMVELRSINDFESFQPDRWNIPIPSRDSLSSRANCFGDKGLTHGKEIRAGDEHGLDLIVMPGMAFDGSFGRLGHGKGYYDYFLRRCQASSQMPFRGKNYWYFFFVIGYAN